MKILIEIDTDTQRVVPLALLDSFPEINPSNYDHDDACALNDWGVELILAAAPQPEPVDADLRRDAFRRGAEYAFNMTGTNEGLTVCDEEIDRVMAQGEQK